MSTFAGKIAEIPNISVDRFDGDNEDSLAFFLSHCHIDHMVGLDSSTFQRKLVENKRFLYVSHVSAQILKRDFPDISDNLVELDQYFSTTVAVGEKFVAVTPIPAGHCPGSIMLLFEGDSTVLYTGDYRINSKDIPKLKAFYDSMDIKKTIDAVYLDTTFFLKSYAKFPLRAESTEEICRIIKEWIGKSDKHVIGLQTSARYGYEYLFIEIWKELKMPIHVNDEAYQFYSRIPELDQAVTRRKEITKIHSACGSDHRVICQNTVAYNVKTIKVSAFRWKSDELENGISGPCDYNHDLHYVCYSTHASYEEGVALLKFLKPKKVEANVLHKDAAKNREIWKNIKELVDEDESVISRKRVKLFDIAEEKQETKSTALPLFNSIFDSPPRFTS